MNSKGTNFLIWAVFSPFVRDNVIFLGWLFTSLVYTKTVIYFSVDKE